MASQTEVSLVDKYLLVLQIIMVAGMNQSGWEPSENIVSAMNLLWLNHFSLTISM